MSYRVLPTRRLRAKILSWGLSDFVLTDIYLRLSELADNPAEQLVSLESPFTGMVLRHSLIDPENRMCQHVFWFHVVYSADETALLVINGAHFRSILG